QEPTDAEVDAVAASILWETSGRHWEDITDGERREYREYARAALSAARTARRDEETRCPRSTHPSARRARSPTSSPSGTWGAPATPSWAPRPPPRRSSSRSDDPPRAATRRAPAARPLPTSRRTEHDRHRVRAVRHQPDR